MSLEERKWVMCVGGCRLHSPTLLFLTTTEERERERVQGMNGGCDRYATVTQGALILT